MDSVVLFVKKVVKKLPVLIADAVAIPVAWLLAYWFRYNLHFFSASWHAADFWIALMVMASVQVVCYYFFRVYRGIWRFISINDVGRILSAVAVATTIAMILFHETVLHRMVPRAVVPLYGLILTALLCGVRLLRRLYWDYQAISLENRDCQRVLIIGAGQAGEGLIRDLKRTGTYYPVGLIDDSPSKLGLEVRGVRVLGNIAQLVQHVIQSNAGLIFIAIPSANTIAMQRIVAQCERCNIPFRTLPGLDAIAAGQVEVNALREVRIEDLLGRDKVELNWDKIAFEIQGKNVLVTGGGGSIGSELCRQIIQQQPAKLLILDNNEFNLYSIDLELRKNFPESNVALALISVTDHIAVDACMAAFKPDIVFHAAAFKQVPMLEQQVRVAVMNNIVGTQIVAEASVKARVEKFVLISTDKAVNPSNVMGTTKRIAEIYCQNLNKRVHTQFITVRFGNVLGSVGSVVPLFKEQLKAGGPITVTHPDMLRYFMTIPEAAQLILQAMANGQGGEIFVLDMGTPVNITYLAEQMIRLAGKIPNQDIHIQYTGLRPGEKLFEELFHASEKLIETDHEKLFKANFREIDWEQFIVTLASLQRACLSTEDEPLRPLLKSLVPEFQCASVEGVKEVEPTLS